MSHRAILGVVFVMIVTVGAYGRGAAQTGTVVVFAKSIRWFDLDIPGFAKGVQFASMATEPKVAGRTYTIRFKFPDGFVLPPHYYPEAVTVTVLSGTFMLGHGNKAVAPPPNPWPTEGTYGPGDLFHIPATRPHYGQVKGETVLQIHGVGPFGIFLAK